MSGAAPLRVPRAATVVLDVDSTLSGIEGIDWLATRRGPAVAAQVQRETQAAMDGAVALEAVYGARLAAVRPTGSEIAALADAYYMERAPGVEMVVPRLQASGIRCIVVSGGIRQAIVPFAARLGIAEHDVHAVALRFDASGAYAGFDEASPLARRHGKPAVVRALSGLARPIVAIGDGDTDAELAEVVDAFWAFTGFVRRPRVLARAAREVRDFQETERRLLE